MTKEQDPEHFYEFARNAEDSDTNIYKIYPVEALPVAEVFNFKGEATNELLDAAMSHLGQAYADEYVKKGIGEVRIRVSVHKGIKGKAVFIIRKVEEGEKDEIQTT